MQSQTFKKIVRILILLFLVVMLFLFVSHLGGKNILNDLSTAVETLKSLNISGLLDNPPGELSDISEMAESELGLTYNPSDLRGQIQENKNRLMSFQFDFIIILRILIVLIILRIFLKKIVGVFRRFKKK